MLRDLSPDARLSIWMKDLVSDREKCFRSTLTLYQTLTRTQLSQGGVDISLVDTCLSLFRRTAEMGSASDSDICVVKCWLPTIQFA
jgi:hypothetical protein